LRRRASASQTKITPNGVAFVFDPLPWLSELTKDREWIRDGIEELGLVV
jgi:hypothetical protein